MIKEEHQLLNVIVRAILIEDGKLVVVKWKRDSEPTGEMGILIGGRVEFGEELSEALIREVKEETGLDVKIERHLYTHQSVFVSRRTGQEIHELGWYFLVSPLNPSDEACPNDAVVPNPDHPAMSNYRVPLTETGLAPIYPVFLREYLPRDIKNGFQQGPQIVYRNFKDNRTLDWPIEWFSPSTPTNSNR